MHYLGGHICQQDANSIATTKIVQLTERDLT